CLAPLDHRHALHQQILYADRQLIRLLECRDVMNLLGIEDRDVGPETLLENAAISEAQSLRGQRSELADRVLQCQSMLLAHVLAQYPWKRAVGARVRVLLAENARWRRAAGVIVNGHPGLLESQRDVTLLHTKHCNGGVS